jgi:hypothetical protein
MGENGPALTEAQTNEAIIEDKQFRKDIDEILQRVKKSVYFTRERALGITKLQEAIMWFGMDLKELNDGRTIYPDSYDPTNTKVDPPADGLKM